MKPKIIILTIVLIALAVIGIWYRLENASTTFTVTEKIVMDCPYSNLRDYACNSDSTSIAYTISVAEHFQVVFNGNVIEELDVEPSRLRISNNGKFISYKIEDTDGKFQISNGKIRSEKFDIIRDTIVTNIGDIYFLAEEAGKKYVVRLGGKTIEFDDLRYNSLLFDDTSKTLYYSAKGNENWELYRNDKLIASHEYIGPIAMSRKGANLIYMYRENGKDFISVAGKAVGPFDEVEEGVYSIGNNPENYCFVTVDDGEEYFRTRTEVFGPYPTYTFVIPRYHNGGKDLFFVVKGTNDSCKMIRNGTTVATQHRIYGIVRMLEKEGDLIYVSRNSVPLTEVWLNNRRLGTYMAASLLSTSISRKHYAYIATANDENLTSFPVIDGVNGDIYQNILISSESIKSKSSLFISENQIRFFAIKNNQLLSVTCHIDE